MSQNKNLMDELKKRKRGSSKKDDWPYKASKENYFTAPRCYTTHPPLQLPNTDLFVYGGSCSTPVVTDADVYIGLCSSMRTTPRSWPWKVGTEFLFAITDMQAPSNPEEFKKMINWAKDQIDSGQKVHFGCIGGHGRTGTALSALVSLYGEKDAIKYVRKNYCERAVESSVQVKFLGEHFGILPASGAKEHTRPTSNATYPKSKKLTGNPDKASSVSRVPASGKKDVSPLAGFKSVWDE